MGGVMARQKWVRFVADYDWTPPNRKSVCLSFRAGQRYRVTGPQARDAIAAGKAEACAAPKPAADSDDDRGKAD